MSADRYEILDDGALTIAIKLGENTQYVDELEDDFVVGAIRQQARDLEIRNEWYANALNELDDKRSEITKLRAELAAAVAENAALLAANRDLKAHFDALKGDYDEAAHFARHFIRDDAAITPRGAIIRLGDKCTSLFARMKIAETERDEWIACHAQLYRKLGNLLAVIHRDGGHYESEHGTEKACADAELAVHVQRGIADGYHDALKIWRQRAEQSEARLAAIDAAPTVGWLRPYGRGISTSEPSGERMPQYELIARPAKD